MTYYTIFDNAEKSIVYNQKTGTATNGYRDANVLKFRTKKAAEQYKDDYLSVGNYPDRPHTVLSITKNN